MTAPRPFPPSDDHPGGPLSRAERVLLSNMRRTVREARDLLFSLNHVIGAIPGAQTIDRDHREALAAAEKLLVTMLQRKQGAQP